MLQERYPDMSSTNGENNEMVVTPWEVKGKVDYERLIKEFGTQPLTPELLAKVEKHTDKLHLQIERRIFFSHRDLDTVLNLYEQGTKFVLYTAGTQRPSHGTLSHGYSPCICSRNSKPASTSKSPTTRNTSSTTSGPQRNRQMVLRKRARPNRAWV